MTATRPGVKPILYAIEIDAIVDSRWSEWFDDLDVTLTPSTSNPQHTILSARLPDQSALPALLSRVTGLNLKILSVTPGATPGGV